MSDEQAKQSANPADQAADQAGGKQVRLQKIYLQDASVEVPDGPLVFTREFKPQVDVDLNTRVRSVGEATHQINLRVTVTASMGDKTAYIVEVDQAGVFQLAGFDNADEHDRILGAYCPGTLFPFVRESVNDLVQRAGFPQFLLQPVNFEALYQQRRQQADAEVRH